MRQGYPISPKLFTTTNQEVFKGTQLEDKWIHLDGEKLSNLRFVDNVALARQGGKDMEQQLNTVTEESLITLKIHKGKKFWQKTNTTDK